MDAETMNRIAERFVAGTISAESVAAAIKDQADQRKLLTIIDQRMKATMEQIEKTLQKAFEKRDKV